MDWSSFSLRNAHSRETSKKAPQVQEWDPKEFSPAGTKLSLKCCGFSSGGTSYRLCRNSASVHFLL